MTTTMTATGNERALTPRARGYNLRAEAKPRPRNVDALCVRQHLATALPASVVCGNVNACTSNRVWGVD